MIVAMVTNACAPTSLAPTAEPSATTSAAPSAETSPLTTVDPAAPATSAPDEFLPPRRLDGANGHTAAADLAALIVDAPDTATAYSATADALARAGIRIETMDHVFVEPVEPAARSSMWPRQVLAAALEAQNRRFVDRISAEDAGTVLEAMGWPLASDGVSAGDGWLAFLRAWLADAHANSADPTSFAPLFAAEMIRLSDGVDLRQAATADVHFGLLELLVLSAGFERVDPTAHRFTVAIARPGTDQAVGRHAIEGPCDSTMERYGFAPPSGPGSDAPEWMRNQAVALVLGQAGESVGFALTALGHFQKIWRAVAFYLYSFVRVEPSDKRLHKPNEDQPFIHTTFTAKTGIDAEGLKGWVRDHGGPNGVREMNDDLRCAESLGIPRLTDVGDIAAEVENWMVDWEVVEGMPEHAELAELCGSAPTSVCNRFDRYSTLGMKLRRIGPSLAEADLFVRLKEEKQSDHSTGAIEHEVPVSVRAKVDASTIPSISIGDLTSPQGLIGPGLETIAGLIQSSFKPSSKATVIVTYHKAEGYQFVFDWTGTYVDPVPNGPRPVTYNAWALLCPGAAEWQIWEVWESPDATYTTGAPGAAVYGPIFASFDEAGMMNGSRFPGLAAANPEFYAALWIDGKTLAETSFRLSPPDGPPTSVTADILMEHGPRATGSAPVTEMDGSFGTCEETP